MERPRLFLSFLALSVALGSAFQVSWRVPSYASSRRSASSLLAAGEAADDAITITFAFPLCEEENSQQDQLKELMSSHPLLSMMDARTECVEVPVASDSTAAVDATVAKQFEETIAGFDIACFSSPSQVKSWVHTLDHIMGVLDQSDDERKAIGNRGNVPMVACIGSETARVCLETGRWEAYKIYYPKGDDDVQGWADSGAQAAADVLEEQFWE